MNLKTATIIMLALMVCEDELTIPKAEQYLKNLDNSFMYTSVPNSLPLVIAALKGAKINGD